ncbi:MAG TPA: hypothetical protein VM100_05975 [Longimicrobiales bacterium]|nr:hypothetical protein [Longimicrobiales bacterium]
MTTTLLIGVLAASFAQQTDTTIAVRAGARVDVEAFGGSITVKTWDRNSIRVQAVHGRRDVVSIDSRSNAVKIEAEGRMGTPTNVDFTITTPASVSLNLSGVYTEIDVDGVTGDIEAETVQGNIKVSGGARLKLESVEGDIVIDHARGRISANTVNRGIRITNVVGDIEAETVNGPIIVQGAQATNVDLATVNGRIVYDGTIRNNGDYSIASHNGGIWVVVPAGAGANVSISTFNGELDASMPVTLDKGANKRRYSFVLGNGGARLELESFGGDIHLRRPNETLPTQAETPRKPKAPKIKVKIDNDNDD